MYVLLCRFKKMPVVDASEERCPSDNFSLCLIVVWCIVAHRESWGFGAGMRCGAGTVEVEERSQTNFHCLDRDRVYCVELTPASRRCDAVPV